MKSIIIVIKLPNGFCSGPTESYVQGHKKKHAAKSPSQLWVTTPSYPVPFWGIYRWGRCGAQWVLLFLSARLSRAKSPQGDGWRGGAGAELNGPTDRRKKSGSQDAEQVGRHSCVCVAMWICAGFLLQLSHSILFYPFLFILRNVRSWFLCVVLCAALRGKP